MIEILRHIDHQLFHFVNQTLANPFLDFICPVFRDIKFLVFCYCLFAYRIYKLYPEHFLKIAATGALTFLLTDQLSAHLIKSLIHRIRPCNNSEIDARLLLEHCGNGFSFVSAHAANSFGMAAFISSFPKNRTQTIIVFGIWAALVSFSQVYVGVHFPADVIGGALLGVITGVTTGAILKSKITID